MVDIKIKLKADMALQQVALEVQALNQFVDGDKFPRPIACNPDSTIPEGFLGYCNTPPDADGFVTIRLLDYDYFDTGIMDDLGVKPTTFSFIYGNVGGSLM